MHLRIENIKELKVAVRHLKRLATKNLIYALNSVKIASAGGSVSLTASNGDTLLRYTPKDASGTEDIEFLLDAKYLSDLLKTVKDALVFEVDEEGKKVTITSGKLRHQTYTESADTFPSSFSFKVDSEHEATLHPHLLASIQEATLFVSKDDARANLMCVALGPNRIMATDGHRLYLMHVTLPNLLSEINLTPQVCELLKVLGTTGDTIEVRIKTSGFYTLEQGPWFIQCADDRVDTPLPNQEAIAGFFQEEASANTLRVDSKELAFALEASRLSWNDLNRVVLEGDSEGNALLKSGDFSLCIGKAVTDSMVPLNGRYLLDVAKVFTGDIVITFTTGKNPILFHAALMGATLKNTGCVIMPLIDRT